MISQKGAILTIEQDTIKLLRECDAGIKMGVSALDEVMKYTSSEELKSRLLDGMSENESIKNELQKKLNKYHDDGKEPNPMAKGMSWMKTNVKLSVNESDETIAEVITDGCNMGVKSICKYLNKYQAADEDSKNIAKKLVKYEEKLAVDMRRFL